MMNAIISAKQIRMTRIKNTINEARKKGIEINKEKLISTLIVECLISKARAKEEVEAILNYLS